MTPISILHLEDSALDHDLIEHTIRRSNIDASIVRASSRSEFLRLYEKGNWDVILADYHLPDYDGMTALQHVRRRDPDLPFIFVSGVLGEEIAIETLKSGATDYVLKARLGRLPSSLKRVLQELDDRLRLRAAEDALIETEHRFEAMADAAPMLIWVMGRSGDHQFFNRMWLEFFGKSLEHELVGGWTLFIHADDRTRWTECFDEHFNRREAFTIELRLLRADGQYRWLVMNVSPRRNASGEFLGMIGSSIDITELKNSEERLRHVAKLESLGILAGGIAHDFNNLLTGILGHAELLRDELPENDRKAPLLDNILLAGNSAAQLTRQMLAYSGRGHFIIEPVNLSNLVRKNKTLIDASIPRSVKVDFDIQDDLPSVDADPGQVQQVVMNLIINAAEATENKNGEVCVRTYLHEVLLHATESNLIGDPLQHGRYIIFEVSDNGVGMDAATRARIFDPFFTTKFTGRGLGLAAVLGILRGHKAGLRLRSEPGQGSTFTVLFPEVTQSTHVEVSPKTESRFAQPCVVLLVDDEPLVLNSLRLVLRRSGFRVVTAVNGEDALEKLNPSFDLVVLDTVMTKMSGPQALTRMRSLYPEMPIVGMSGFSEGEAAERFGNQLDAFLQKPFTGPRLVETISSVLETRKKHQRAVQEVATEHSPD